MPQPYSPMDVIGHDKAAALIRAREIPDAASLANALAAGGIRAVEFPFTAPNVIDYIEAARGSNALIGAGTVLTSTHAKAALAAGAQFLVTPGLNASVAQLGHAEGVPVIMGAFTPSEVMQALELGAAAVKVFPAETLGATYFSHLLGPLPAASLIAAGGITADNAHSFIDAGAFAVTAGTSIVSAHDLATSNWASIEHATRRFVSTLGN